jgi:hypothetical protein
MTQKATVPVLANDKPEFVTLRALHEDVAPFRQRSHYAIELHAYGKTDEGRDRSILIPAREARYVKTGYAMEREAHVMPMLFTPALLLEKNLETLMLRENEETGEIEIRIQSFVHTSVYIGHGTPIAVLHFVSSIVVQGRDGGKQDA